MQVSKLIKRLEDSRRGIPFERDVLAYGGMAGRRLLRVEQDGAELFLGAGLRRHGWPPAAAGGTGRRRTVPGIRRR